MESMKIIRSQISPIAQVDFFLNESNLSNKHEDEHVASVIKGVNYAKTKQRINEFINRCEQTLDGLLQRVAQTEHEFNSLVSEAQSKNPGREPSTLFLDRSNSDSVNRHNEAVHKFNARLDLHRRLVDQAERAKERYDTAVEKYNEKKVEIDDQIRERMEELKPALDQDILSILGKMQQLSYDTLNNKHDSFSGFLLIYLSKRAYIFLYDYIGNPADQRAASDIFKKLNEEMDMAMSSSVHAVKEGMHSAALFLSRVYANNSELQKSILSELLKLPYEQCKKSSSDVNAILSLPVEITFQYKHHIDPEALAKVETTIKKRQEEFTIVINRIDDLVSRLDESFSVIEAIRNFANAQLEKMDQNKVGLIDPISTDLFFALGIFDEANQERYLKKHMPFLQQVQSESEKILGINLSDMVKDAVKNEFLTKPTRTTIQTDPAILFLTNREKLIHTKKQFSEGMVALDGVLKEINELPRQKAEEFARRIQMWMLIAILPVANLGLLFPIWSWFNRYKPAFKSTNSYYIDLKKRQLQKLATFLCAHAALCVLCLSGTLLLAPPMQFILMIAGGSYAVSAFVLFLTRKRLQQTGAGA